MQTKIHINIPSGIVEVEGEENFVLSVYSEFKELLIKKFQETHGISFKNEDNLQSNKGEKKRRVSKKTNRNSDNSNQKVKQYSPTLDKTLDLSLLPEFFGKYIAKSHPEKILLFAVFLREKLNISPCTADQLYSCYIKLKERLPKVFLQAIRDTHGKKNGFVDYKAVDDIFITTIGENYFNHDLPRKDAQ